MIIQDILNAKGSGVVSIVQTETIQVAAKILRDKKFGSLVVRDRHGRLAGIITERDILRACAQHRAPLGELPVQREARHVRTHRRSLDRSNPTTNH